MVTCASPTTEKTQAECMRMQPDAGRLQERHAKWQLHGEFMWVASFAVWTVPGASVTKSAFSVVLVVWYK